MFWNNRKAETAIQRASEFINIGKASEALDHLYGVLKAKGNRATGADGLLEPVITKYIEIGVDLQRSHSIKQGLIHYRNVSQSPSLETVVKRYLELAEEKTAEARRQLSHAVPDINDLDEIDIPEETLFNVLSAENAQRRRERTILVRWVKFLWDSYRQCLDLLRNNARVEFLYHYVAKKAFSFCEEYKRKTEFRKLCEYLRLHLAQVLKQTGNQNAINLLWPETQHLNFDTRMYQLDKAVKMEMWTEAFRVIEDIHEFGINAKTKLQPKFLVKYFKKLSLVLWKGGNYLFHVATLFKIYNLSIKYKNNITLEEKQRLASRVFLATLAIPLPSAHPEFDRFFETEKSALEKQQRLAKILSLQEPLTREGLVKDLVHLEVINHVNPTLKELYDLLEVNFNPWKLCNRVDACLQSIDSLEEQLSKDLKEYTSAVQNTALVCLLKQLAQIYGSIDFPRLLEMSVFADMFRLERTIVDTVRYNDMKIRIDQRNNCIHFDTDLSNSLKVGLKEEDYFQHMPLGTVCAEMLDVATSFIDVLSNTLVEVGQNENKKARESIAEEDCILVRCSMTEQNEEPVEKLATEKKVEDRQPQEGVSRLDLQAEQRRLGQERLKRERLRKELELKEIQAKQVKEKIAKISDQKVAKRLGTNIENLDSETLLKKQIEEIEKERAEAVKRLKSQAKKFDYLERAKRLEEIPLLQKELEDRQIKEMNLWEKTEKERVHTVIEERNIVIANKKRLQRMSVDKNKFLEMIKSKRHAEYEEKLKEWQANLDQEREVRLVQKRELIIKQRQENRKKQREEMLRKQKEEVERKRKEQEEEEKKERLRKEKEERDRFNREIDARAETQRKREIEIEERERRAKEERGYHGGFAKQDRDPTEVQNWRKAPRAHTAAEPYRPPHTVQAVGVYKPPQSHPNSNRSNSQREPQTRDDGGSWRRARPTEDFDRGRRDGQREELDQGCGDRRWSDRQDMKNRSSKKSRW